MRFGFMMFFIATSAACSFSGGSGTNDELDAGRSVDVDAGPDAPDALTTNPDRDNDGVVNEDDNCPVMANPNQENEDTDPLGNVCDVCPHLDDPDQADDDNDGVGNACDPQPGLQNSWLFFTGFDAPLVAADWVGEDGWTVSEGELVSLNNQDRYVLRNTTFDHGDRTEVGAQLSFANPLADNGTTFRLGGPTVRAGPNEENNSCWVFRDARDGFQGYAFVRSDQGGLASNNFLSSTLADVAFNVVVVANDTDYDCEFLPEGGAVSTISRTTNVNDDNENVGVVSSYTDTRVAYLYSISLQP